MINLEGQTAFTSSAATFVSMHRNNIINGNRNFAIKGLTILIAEIAYAIILALTPVEFVARLVAGILTGCGITKFSRMCFRTSKDAFSNTFTLILCLILNLVMIQSNDSSAPKRAAPNEKSELLRA